MKTAHHGWALYEVTVDCGELIGEHTFIVYAPVSDPDTAIQAVRDWEDSEGGCPFEGEDLYNEGRFSAEEYHPSSFAGRDVFPSEDEVQVVSHTVIESQGF